MYYDIYDDIILLHKPNVTSTDLKTFNSSDTEIKCPKPVEIINFLSKGYKKIYLKQKCVGEYRKNDLRWISPYPEGPYDSYYLCKENKKLFYGCVKSTFYNIRYSTDRQNLKDYVSELLKTRALNKEPSLAIVGSGISPYTVYLKDLFQITEYECNSEAYRFGNINKALNKTTIFNSYNSKYNSQFYDFILSIVPAEPLEFHKKYNFKTDLFLYYTCLNSNLTDHIQLLCDYYNAHCVKFKIVRPYSKLINTYFIHFCKIKKQF